MTDPHRLVVVRTATSPAEAQVLVAVLQAEGIPAFVEGSALADEVAISRRAMNLSGTKVHVPADRLDDARRILAAAAVPEDELTALALAESPDNERPPAARPAAARSGYALPIALLVASGAALTFLGLWRAAAAQLPDTSAYRFEPLPDGVRWYRRDTGQVVRDYRYSGPTLSSIQTYALDGTLVSIAREPDADGVFLVVDEFHEGGVQVTWTASPATRRFARCVVRDAKGEVVRRQHLDGTRGFVDTP